MPALNLHNFGSCETVLADDLGFERSKTCQNFWSGASQSTLQPFPCRFFKAFKCLSQYPMLFAVNDVAGFQNHYVIVDYT